MRRVLRALLPLLFAVGCDSAAAPPLAPVAELRVGFPPGGVADTIRIDAVDRLPLRAAVLVAPDGATTPANHLDVVATPRIAAGQFVAGNPWTGALSSGAAAASFGIPQAGAALASQEQLLATVSTAEITLPDPVPYRRDWRRYRIHLSFGTPPGEVETRELPAPPPPPGS